jgi:membrane protein YdbS with pleckstrin-like domain
VTSASRPAGAVERWFRVSPDPPESPAGRDALAFRPAPGFLAYLRVAFWIRTVLIAFLVFAGAVLLALELPPGWAALLGGGGILLFFLWVLVDHWALQLRYDHTWYIVTDRSVRIRHGIWTIREGTVTFENAQNVRVRQGPLQRWFGIADVVMETAAAGVATGQGVTMANQAIVAGVANAPGLRDRIAERMRRSRSAGLGGDGPLAPSRPSRDGATAGPRASARAGGTPAWRPAHLGALREIRDAVGRLGSGESADPPPGGPGEGFPTD